MTIQTKIKFLHHELGPSLFESRCPLCDKIVGTRQRESLLRVDEAQHACGVPTDSPKSHTED